MADQTIAEIEQAHPDEWLVIRVTKKNKNDEPLRGEVLSHSPDRDEAYKVLWAHRDEKYLMTTFTGRLPKGRVVVLNISHWF